MERRAFEAKIGDRDIVLELGNCAVNLFRTQSELDYVAVDISEDDNDSILRIFNNVEFARWLAGYAPVLKDETVYRPTTRNAEMGNSTFRELYGWNPATIEREEPSESEVQMWIEVNSEDLDGEREW